MLEGTDQQSPAIEAAEMTDLYPKESREGLAEVEAIARTGVTSAVLARADIVDGRYALTFQPKAGHRPAPERVLGELEAALNRKRYRTSDATGVMVRFEEAGV
jgi:hypothetical protein